MTNRNPLLARIERREAGIDITSHAYRRSKLQEKQLAKRVGGKLVPRSGAGSRKGDVQKRGVIRIEAKTTQAKSFSITREMVDVITAAALGMDEIPAIVVEFLDSAGKPTHEIAIVPTSFLEQITNAQIPDRSS